MIKKLSVLSKTASATLLFQKKFKIADMKKVIEILDAHGVVDAKAGISGENKEVFKIEIISEVVPENFNSLKEKLKPFILGIQVK